jgi:hypothetical protein
MLVLSRRPQEAIVIPGLGVTTGSCACDPSCSDSLNGATTEPPTSSSLSQPDLGQAKRVIVTSNGARGLTIAARQQKRWWTVGRDH